MHMEFKKGKITGIRISSGMDDLYKKIFKNAQKSLRRNPNDVMNGVKVIIFGAFLIESICNRLYRVTLFNEIKNESLSVMLWEGTKRKGVYDKLNLICSRFKKVKGEKYLKKVQSLFEMRNRLSHFQDDISDIGLAKNFNAMVNDHDYEKFFEILENIPETKLMSELKQPNIQKYINIIDEIEEFINSYLAEYYEFKVKDFETIDKLMTTGSLDVQLLENRSLKTKGLVINENTSYG